MTDLQTDEGIERLLAAALTEARSSARWAVEPAPGTGERVRHAVRASRRRRTALLVAGSVVAISGVAGGIAAMPEQADRAVPFASGGDGPVPGISPEWRPQHGHEWLLTAEQYREFERTHTLPSAKPATVSSPAPLTAYSAQLEAAVKAALPTGSSTQRQDAPNGKLGDAAVHAVLVDRTPVEIERVHLQHPITFDFPGHVIKGAVAPVDIAGTTSAYVALEEVGYGWGEDCVAKTCTPRPANARAVTVVDRNGEATTWHAPLSVPLQTVVDWALAAASHSS